MATLPQVLSFENNELTAIVENGEIFFPASKLAKTLGFANPHQAVNSHVELCDLQKLEVIDTLGRKQKINYVNESGMYALIFGSTKPEAKRFKRWVTSEVLPSIRKTGSYGKNENTIEINFDELSPLSNPHDVTFGVSDYPLRSALDSAIAEVAKCYVDEKQAKKAIEQHVADICKMPHHSWITKDRFGVALYALSQLSLKAYAHKRVLQQIDKNAIKCLEVEVLKTPVIVYQGV